VTSDHGEGFGEHDLFEHGESLYRSELRVPLLIVPPGGGRGQRVVKKTVSQRDLPATVVDLVGLADGSPFPGNSLAALWRDHAELHRPGRNELVLSELSAPNPINPNAGRSPAYRGPLISIADGELVYIRNEKDQSEQLFDIRDDPRELTNRASSARFADTVERFRSLYNECKSGGQSVGSRANQIVRNQEGRTDE
jgi:arylsulfatase A-like enzyme